MQQPVTPGTHPLAAPSFYITGGQRLGPGAILLAIATAISALALVVYALGHNGHSYLNSSSTRSPNTASASTPSDDDKDDPNQIDTIVLGDPSDAPTPARPGNHVSPVRPTILVHLPRYGDQVGLIPDSPAGHLLYNWLAAFNQSSFPALGNALPILSLASSAAAQIELRQHTGGFNLLSAKEVQPGILVFRLRDQTPSATEVLGTLQVLPGSNPAAIASFSLRAVPSPHQDASPTSPAAPPR